MFRLNNWGMVTRAAVSFPTERKAILKQGGKQLDLSILAPTEAKLELFETKDPPDDYDARH